jgi:hypothetical protein
MCSRPDFESEEQELDRRLLSLFREWKAYGEFWGATEDTPEIDYIDIFCREVQSRLSELLRSARERTEAGPGAQE